MYNEISIFASLILLTVFLTVLVWNKTQKNGCIKAMIDLQIFAIEIAKVIKSKKLHTNTCKYCLFLNTVPLVLHSDFKKIRKTKFFRRKIFDIRKIHTPNYNLYGYCVVLAKYYESIRREMSKTSFIDSLNMRFQGCFPAFQLAEIIMNSRHILLGKRHIGNCSFAEVYYLTNFVGLMMLYYVSLEDAENDVSYNLEDFCNLLKQDTNFNFLHLGLF